MTGTMIELEHDLALLDRAARCAVRGHGHVEPNPMVGCVATDTDGEVVAVAHHQRHGGPHAEVLAIEMAGARLRGGTLYVTLEPCTHEGQTGPCTSALLDAGVSRVVIGQRDPNPEASGGAEILRAAGIEVDVLDHEASRLLIAPHVIRLQQQRPWVQAKWAQTVDGRIATRSGQSRWISSSRSRSMVHRQRGRVDAVLTGIGTVMNDDPRLTARQGRPRRIPRRVLVDPGLDIPMDSALLATMDEAPLTIACLEDAPAGQQNALRQSGVDVIALPSHEGRLDLRSLLQLLHSNHGISTVLVEAGPGLLSSLLEAGCVDEACVFIAPTLLGDEEAIPPLKGRAPETIDGGLGMTLQQVHRRGEDVLLRYGMPPGNS
jgi:diaminohydroxyphosphoribosylaminopyrimidine deaminase/5-amino-6-(5-phosphoribosylamino)uracil reductase